MITFLRGVLEDKQPTSIEVDVGGVGYEVFITLSTYDALPTEGSECVVYIHESIREDAYQLYGFATKVERAMFRMLLNVSGVGPKIAIGALSGMTVRDLKNCIVEGDSKRISKIPGVGKKTAERIIVELKDKINPLEALGGSTDSSDNVEDNREFAHIVNDAVMALVSLGQSHDVAIKVVRNIITQYDKDNTPTVEDVIKKSLSAIMK